MHTDPARSSVRLALAGAGLVAAAAALVPLAAPAPVLAQDGGTVAAGETAERGTQRSVASVAAEADRLVADAWKAAGITPNRACTDEEFVRRIHLDLIGTLPTALQAEDFLKDTSPRKREKLVDALLESPGFARHWANQWGEVLVGTGVGDNNRDFVPSLFLAWLERQFAADRPYGEIVTDLVTAQGSPYSNPPVNFTSRLDNGPNNLAGITSRAFLGVQIQCAECHDHPYEEIRQADFQGFAAFWGRMRIAPADIPYEMFGPQAVERERMRIEKDVQEMVKTGIPEAEAKIRAERKKLRTRALSDIPGDVRVPKALAEGRAKQLGDAAKNAPKFLLAAQYQDKPGETRRGALASWIVNPANPYTAKALANRVWGWMLGRGVVHPVDDFSSVNLPSVPGLLELLAGDTSVSGFDQKRLVRIIAQTRAYQTSTAARERKPRAVELFAAGPLKPLTPQQSFDSLNVALGVVADGRRLTIEQAPVTALEMEGGRPGMRPADMTSDSAPSAAETRMKQALTGAARNFFKNFDDDEGGAAPDFEGTVPQGLFLMNSEVLNGLLSNPRVSVLPKVISQHSSDRDRLRHLFLRTLAREPRPDEAERFLSHVKTLSPAKERKRTRFNEDAALAPWADVLWVLVSSSEFGSNH